MRTYALIPVRTVAAASAPITLAQAKDHLNELDDEFDTLINVLIEAVTDHLDGYEGILGRALVTQTWTQSFPCFPVSFVRLPLAPVQSVSSVKYFDESNVEQTVDTAVYSLHEDVIGPFVDLNEGQSWPSAFDRHDAVTIEFVAGYGDATAVPQAIKNAMKLMIGDLYQHRESVVVGTISAEIQMSTTVDSLLRKFKRGIL